MVYCADVLRIGELSRLSGVSVKTLRFYADAGLLPPAEVDAESGYRQYTVAQLATLRTILRLRELGIPLRDIKQVLDAPGTMAECLRARRHEIGRSIAGARRQLAAIDELLAGGRPGVPVTLRRLPQMTAVSLRARLGSYDDCDGLLAEVASRMPRRARAIGRGAIWHCCESEGPLDCEAIVLTPRPVEIRGSALRAIATPPSEVAVAVYEGEDFAPAYQAIASWMQSNRCAENGPKRELFLAPGVTEVQIPVTATAAR